MEDKKQNPKGFGPHNRSMEKPNNFKTSMKKVIIYSSKYKLIILAGIILALLGSILILIGPDKLKELTNIIVEGTMLPNGINIDKIWSIGIFLIVIYLLGYIFSSTQGVLMATVTGWVTKKMRSDISKKINKLPMSYYSKTSIGDVLSRVTNDVDTLSQSLNMSVGTLVSALTLFIGSLVMMFTTNVILTITAILSTVVGFVLMMVIMKKSQKYFNHQQQNLGELNSHVEQIYSSHIVVKAYNGEEDSRLEFDRLNESLRNSAFRAQSLSGLMMPIMMFIGNFGYVMVCIVGALLIYENKISFGVIVAFMLYIRYFTNPLSQIAQAMSSLQQAAASSERIFAFLEEKEMLDESNKEKIQAEFTGNVEFKNVSFGYNEDKLIIKDFSLKVKKGQKVAIVGPTGAGKTTIINLLMRFYDINSGSILLDNINTMDIKREDVHSAFCMVLQDTWLFEGTIRENLIYSSKEVTNKDLDKVCKAVGLDHFIKTLSHGYDTVLNDQVSLSGGQRQQLTIARAMLLNKSMLILDEATSSVDTRTELHISQAMDELMKNKTSFVIAHRLSTIKNADVIIVMKDGSIIESGNHNELLNKNGFYASLYNSQFEEK